MKQRRCRGGERRDGERKREWGEEGGRRVGGGRGSEQQILTRLVVLMFSLAARLFELHSPRGFMRN